MSISGTSLRSTSPGYLASERREIEVPVRYVGFDIPNEFVVGYGLDYDERYRDLPYIGTLDPKVYSS